MPDFQLVSHPTISPTRCATCMTHGSLGGFVDLLIETYVGGFAESGDPVTTGQPLIGRLYLCSGCVTQAGRTVGLVERHTHDALVAEAKRQEGEIAGLRAELEIANSPENKVVTVAEAVELAKVIQLDAERAKRRPAAPSKRAS